MSFSDLMLFALSSNQELAQRVSREMGLPLGKSTVRQFSDGEIQVNIEESIRGKDVYILQSTSSPVNDNLMEILIMVDALKRASAQSINVVMPYYGYARQDRKARAREPITSKLVANMLEVAGVDRLLTIDYVCPSLSLVEFFQMPLSLSAANAVNPTEQVVTIITTAKNRLSNFLPVFIIHLSF